MAIVRFNSGTSKEWTSGKQIQVRRGVMPGRQRRTSTHVVRLARCRIANLKQPCRDEKAELKDEINDSEHNQQPDDKDNRDNP
jgi:hypothetical protein